MVRVAIRSAVYGHWFDHHRYGRTFVSLSLVAILGTTLWWWIGRPKDPLATA